MTKEVVDERSEKHDGVVVGAPDIAAIREIRAQFPGLNARGRHGGPVAYLDSAATSHKPASVIAAELDFYERTNAAVHRGAHFAAEQATEAFESARADVAGLVGVKPDEIVWTSGTTSALNLVASAFGRASVGRGGFAAQRFALRPGDEIVVTEAEHHSNLLPWQELCARTGAVLRWIPLGDDGRLDLAGLRAGAGPINERTRIVAFTHASNVTGAVTPVAEIVAAAQAVDAYTVLDACQTVPHLPVNFADLGVDFAAFSGHKMYGPTGIGALFGRAELLADLPPVATGGSMVEVVTMESSTYASPPARFEAGTQPVAQAIGMGAAARWLRELGMERVAAVGSEHTAGLLRIAGVPGVRVVGPLDSDSRLPIVSFTVDGVHAHDVGQVLDDAGIAARVGHHCAQPLHRRFGVSATTRVSASVTTLPGEIESLELALSGVRGFFGLEGQA